MQLINCYQSSKLKDQTAKIDYGCISAWKHAFLNMNKKNLNFTKGKISNTEKYTCNAKKWTKKGSNFSVL